MYIDENFYLTYIHAYIAIICQNKNCFTLEEDLGNKKNIASLDLLLYIHTFVYYTKQSTKKTSI